MKKKKNLKIGLALGSGGVRGLAHIGVLKILSKNGIRIDYIAGCSAGALIGGLYAYFRNPYEIENLFTRMEYKDYLKIVSDPRVTKGFFKGEKAQKFLESWVGNTKIEDLPISFEAVATDLTKGETVSIKKGRLSEAIRISSTLPVIFRPVKKGSKYLIDGGASNPVPVDQVRAMGADIVIAVDLDWCYSSSKNKPKNIEKMSISDIAERSLDIMSYNLAKNDIEKADIVIQPDIKDDGIRDFLHIDKIIKEGEKAGKKALDEIKKYI